MRAVTGDPGARKSGFPSRDHDSVLPATPSSNRISTGALCTRPSEKGVASTAISRTWRANGGFSRGQGPTCASPATGRLRRWSRAVARTRLPPKIVQLATILIGVTRRFNSPKRCLSSASSVTSPTSIWRRSILALRCRRRCASNVTIRTGPRRRRCSRPVRSMHRSRTPVPAATGDRLVSWWPAGARPCALPAMPIWNKKSEALRYRMTLSRWRSVSTATRPMHPVSGVS